ncbi:MAG TPA: cache domain-containing protein [Desulfosporosinus sp.]|nr:cache domain-containing protein [Desulfosporosinus sp.]
MRSLKHHILRLILGSLVLLGACFIVVLGFYMKDRAEAVAVIKVQTDLATCGELIDTKHPGPWYVQDGGLYKGPTKISLNNELVDHLSRLTGDTVTIFLGETRAATTILNSNGERAIGTKVSGNVAQEVLKDGHTYVGKANVVGQWYQTGYVPLRAENGNIIGIFYVGISHAYEWENITRTLITMAELGLALTILVALFTWFSIQRVIIDPLQNIVAGTKEVATGKLTQKIDVSTTKEIGELEDAFNQMIEQIQGLKEKINLAVITNPEKVLAITELTLNNAIVSKTKPMNRMDTPWCSGDEALPKGLSKATLGQIIQFLQATHRPISVEEVAEGVQMTRVTVRRYLEFLEQRGLLKSEQKYGTVGRPVKLFIPL